MGYRSAEPLPAHDRCRQRLVATGVEHCMRMYVVPVAQTASCSPGRSTVAGARWRRSSLVQVPEGVQRAAVPINTTISL
jgi:hypothetical protein